MSSSDMSVVLVMAAPVALLAMLMVRPGRRKQP
jgi:hypothetical protein